MLRILVAALCLACGQQTGATEQTPNDPPPQSARQALLEMFLAKGSADFAKHLPDTARQALIHKGETAESSAVLRIAEIGHQMTTQSEHLETFDTGSTILELQQNNGHEKIQVTVEHDSTMGDDEEIELSLHVYKDGMEEALPVLPRLTFTMRQENKIWKLIELSAAARVPLTDEDYLKGLRKQQNESLEAGARQHLSMIMAAENDYASRHADVGNTCVLGSLFAVDPSSAAEQGLPFYGLDMAKEEWRAYRFSLTGCKGTPASKYRISAVPLDRDSELKTFCADQSGRLKFVVGESASTCFSKGESAGSLISPNSFSDSD